MYTDVVGSLHIVFQFLELQVSNLQFLLLR